jgi:type VI protein secretion system component VasK
MEPFWEKFFFRTTAVIAGLIVAVVVVGYASDSAKDWPVIPVIPLIIAGGILLVGWTYRLQFKF